MIQMVAFLFLFFSVSLSYVAEEDSKLIIIHFSPMNPMLMHLPEDSSFVRGCFYGRLMEKGLVNSAKLILHLQFVKMSSVSPRDISIWSLSYSSLDDNLFMHELQTIAGVVYVEQEMIFQVTPI